MRVVYFSVIRDVLCESVEFEWPVDYVILWVQCRCSEYQESKEIRMKRKRKYFVKKFNWFLLISGSSLILAWRPWLLIYVSSLGHDKHGIKYIYIYIHEDSPFSIEFLCGSEIPLDPIFNKDKIWEQLGKNMSPTPCKMPTK